MTDMDDTTFTEHMRTEMAATERRLDYIANQRRLLDEEETALRQVIQGFAVYLRVKQLPQAGSVPPADLWGAGASPTSIAARTGGGRTPGNRSANMPPRNPTYLTVTVGTAILDVTAKEGKNIHASEYARRIWVIRNDKELAHCKRTLNSELGRLTKNGKLVRSAPNTFGRPTM